MKTALPLLGFWLLMVICAVVVAWLTRGALTPAGLRAWVGSLGMAGAAVFLILSVVAPLVFIPAAPFTVATALLFPWPWSLFWVVITRNVTANLGFALGRWMGRERVGRWIKTESLEEASIRLRRAGLPAVIVMRMLPIAPFCAVSVAAGVSGIRWRDYALGSFLGMVPGSVVALAALGVVFR